MESEPKRYNRGRTDFGTISMEWIELMHGTSSVYEEAILRGGMPAGTSLTDDEGLAQYFAEEAAELDGGEPHWVYVRVPMDILVADFPMLEEPVLGQAAHLAFDNEDDLHEHLDEVGWPDEEEWEKSLELVGAVRVNRPITPDEILRVE